MSCTFLRDYRQCVISRMGFPYRERGVSVIMVAVDATQDAISVMSGKIGALDGVTAKAAYSN